MRTLFNLALVAAGLLLIESQCLALMSIGIIDKARAKEMGIEVRVKDSGPGDVWVELEFTPKGDLKDFQHVNLEIRDGNKLLVGYTPLEPKRTDSGKIQVHVLANREFAAKVSLRIVAGKVLNTAGYDVKIKDFITPNKAP